ncbi:MAG: hypothetical protein HKN49_10785 [Gammaproteobacteria bacterium]|nr:hypothetical protein [Gammaproteobacteria bacterium]
MLTSIRRRRHSWGKQVLGVFAVVWLNLVLQPCVMALESDNHGDCPHCPPEMSQHHAGHDMARMETPCASDGECDPLNEFNYDGRNIQVKADKFEVVLALLPPAFNRNQPTVAGLARSTRDSDHLSGAAPPLRVLYCVYLD